tara:strand:+ start:85 stop:1077 length:993 start_codon:yes stop_codon:yes gene_type:complete
MSQTSKDEIDLGYLINKISEVFKNISVSIYNSIQFCLRNWYFIIGLLIGGIVLGYFSEIDSKPAKKATLILRTNFNTAEYTYNALNTLMVKSVTMDTAFLKQHGFKTVSNEIIEIKISPMINFKDIAENFSQNERGHYNPALETFLANAKFEDEEAISNSFYSGYKFHQVDFVLSNSANQKTIDKVLDYLNDNEIIKRTAQNGKTVLEQNIAMNAFSIEQIDVTISKYNDNNFMGSTSSQILVVDKNFSYSGVIAQKRVLQKENTRLKNELVYADSAIIKVTNPNIVENKRPTYKMKYVTYPLFFVFLFLSIFWLSKKYKAIKQLAKNQS